MYSPYHSVSCDWGELSVNAVDLEYAEAVSDDEISFFPVTSVQFDGLQEVVWAGPKLYLYDTISSASSQEIDLSLLICNLMQQLRAHSTRYLKYLHLHVESKISTLTLCRHEHGAGEHLPHSPARALCLLARSHRQRDRHTAAARH
eukprot:407557-Pelagomonas_calceolata.AAC.1